MKNSWPKFFQFYFVSIAVLVVIGITIELFVSAGRESVYFHTGWERALNLFSFFTIQSNIVVGVTNFMLALNSKRVSNIFWGFRLSGLIAILITFIIQHLLLAKPIHDPWAFTSDLIVHTIVPVLVVAGWLIFGPRKHISWKVIWIAMIFPVSWLIFTFIRGALINWYPYGFIAVGQIGYTTALRNVGIITILFFAIALVAKIADSKLSRFSK
jgi:hypothetical protein